MTDKDRLREMYRIAHNLYVYEYSEENTERLFKELMEVSGVCSNCHGSGEDGDPPDAAGVGGWIGNCRSCDGTGFRKQTNDPT